MLPPKNELLPPLMAHAYQLHPHARCNSARPWMTKSVRQRERALVELAPHEHGLVRPVRPSWWTMDVQARRGVLPNPPAGSGPDVFDVGSVQREPAPGARPPRGGPTG